MLYAGARKPLPQVGQELKVDYVLEGSVRWARGADGRPRVRITPQLIRVADDEHVWADAFEREVGDIFAVQAEISQTHSYLAFNSDRSPARIEKARDGSPHDPRTGIHPCGAIRLSSA